MKKKKTVTLPRVYHPGPGHPPETLAYLNPAEHLLIKQMTDGTAQRGPKGVRSYAVTTGTKTSSTTSSATAGGGGMGAGGQRGAGSNTGPGSGRPGSTSPSTASPNSNTQTGGQSTSPSTASNPTTGGLSAPARTAPSTLGNTSNTATGKAAQAAQANAASVNTGNYPSRGNYAGATPSYARDMGASFNTLTRDLGQPSTSNWSNDRTTFDKWGTGAVGNLYGRSPNNVSEMARTIAGEAANQTPDQRAAVANVMNNRLSLGSGYLGGGTVPGMLRGFDANGYDTLRTGGPNSAYTKAVPGTENYTNGLSAMVDAANPVSSFNQTAPAGVKNATHYYNPADASPSWANTRSFQSTQTAFGDHVFGNPENTVRDVVAARTMPGGTQVASMGTAGLGEAAAMDRARKAAAGLQAMQSVGPVQGPQRYSGPLAAIPAPSSVGMMPPAAPVQGPQRYAGPLASIPSPNSMGMFSPPTGPVSDPRVGLPQGAFPSGPQVRTDPRVSQTPLGGFPASAPRNPSGGMSFTPDLPAAMPQSAFVATDPRVSLTPLGSLPAAKPKATEVAWNVPPMGGALPAQSGWGFGMWGTNRPLPPDPNGGATPGTIHSQTADAASAPPAANTSGWSWDNLRQTASTAVTAAKQKVDAINSDPRVQKINAIAKTNPGLASAIVNMALGLGGKSNSAMGNPQDRSRMVNPMQTAQASQSSPMGGQGGGMPSDPMSALQQLQQNMVAQGATPEELAYIQSIIDELSNQQVA